MSKQGTLETSPIGMGGRLIDGGSNEWYTPAYIFEALGIAFDLDPCAPIGGPLHVPAARYFTIRENGFVQPWEGCVFLNPPYGPKETSRWLARLIEHGNGIALVNVGTETAWGQAGLEACDAVCFPNSRIGFEAADPSQQKKGHNPAKGSMLLAYGPECAKAVRQCGLGVSFEGTDHE